MTRFALSELGDVVTGSTPPSAYPEWFASKGVPFITPSDAFGITPSITTERFLSSEGQRAMQARMVPASSVCFVSIGSTIGKMCMTTEPSVTNQQINSLVVAPEVADARVVFYALKRMVDEIIQQASGSATPIINKAEFSRLVVDLPPLNEQQAIGATLGALDDKIDSNRRLAATSAKLVDALAEELLDNTETKEVPLSEVVDFNRLTITPGAPGEFLRYIDIASVSPGRIDATQDLSWRDAPSRARRGVADGDVLYSTVRPTRRAFVLLVDTLANTVVSTGFAVMTPRPSVGSSLLTSIISRAMFAEYLDSVAQGSAYPVVNVNAMGRYEIDIPCDQSVTSDFEAKTMPLRRLAAYVESESASLAALRDTLLPELLAGRLGPGQAKPGGETHEA